MLQGQMNVETKLLLCFKRSDKCIMTLVWLDLSVSVYMCSCRPICLAHQLLGVAGRQFHWVSPFDFKEKLVNSSFPPIALASQREAGSHPTSTVLGCPESRHILSSTIWVRSLRATPFWSVELSSITASDLQGHLFKYRHPKRVLI